jgi:hypothetical protein
VNGMTSFAFLDHAASVVEHRIADNAAAGLRKFWAKFHIFPKPLDILLKSLMD